MSLKIGINQTTSYSINFSLPKRRKNIIKFIIIHYTGMKLEKEAIKRLCDYKSNVSSHYFIKTNGDILNLVPDLYEAWHAGDSNWKSFKSLNKYSIGIEIHNPGHQHGYQSFKSNQILSLNKLLYYLVKKYKITQKNVLGHSDIAPNRKKDPGEKFYTQRIGINRFDKIKIKNRSNINLNEMLKLYGFHKSYIKKHKTFCIKAVKRSLNYANINHSHSKKFLKDFYNLLSG